MVKATIIDPKAGQKYATPPKTDPLYRFYKSLFHQKRSPMAVKWCLEHGLFSHKTAIIVDATLKLENLAIKLDKPVPAPAKPKVKPTDKSTKKVAKESKTVAKKVPVPKKKA